MPFKKKKIAIVGMSCRLPGDIESPDDYWQVLKNSKDVVSTINPQRWGTDYYQHPNKKEPGKSYTFAAGVLSQVDQFDAGFFGISPREAAQMDPQQRLLLELTWEALENGGQIPEKLAGSQCAVYVGIASTDYAHRRMDDLCSLDPYSMTGNTASIASNRISYLFDLHGPSVSVDTACSSSLVALHQACTSIWSGDAPMAIAGGVNMLLHPFGFIGFSKASMLSPRGRCRAFDDSGDGYVRSEGSGVLFLKPLDDAIADGDPIQAVIVESGINCDGQTKGISLPSQQGQCALLKEVYRKAGVNLDDICYIEAHGTGTAVGDPIETGAISEALAKPRNKPLLIGSAKTNVGHLETASGMAGIFKIILSLKNRAIPESLHFETPNKNIDFEAANLKVVHQFTPLPKTSSPLLMGVNSFGFGGANAHVLLEEFQIGKTAELHSLYKPSVPPLFLSAKSDSALRAMASQYSELLQGIHAPNCPYNYYDIAYSSVHYRQHLKQGLAFSGKNSAEILQKLTTYADGKSTSHDTQGIATAHQLSSPPKLALVFSGNGSQWQGMGCELLQTEPVFRTAVEEINALLATHAHEGEPISLLEEFQASTDHSRLEYTEIAQLLLFALQVGIIKVLKTHGLQADATLGHSVGEVTAAWAAGALTLEQAVLVIYERSHAQGETKGSGRMAAAGLGDEEMLSLLTTLGLQNAITIAGINSPKSVTLSGSLEELEKLTPILDEKNIFYRILDLDYAFHSAQMLPIEQRIKSTLDGLTPLPNQLQFISTVTGSKLEGERLDATYWWENIRQPVEFGKAINTLIDDGFNVFLEIGPHPILRTYINECCRDKEAMCLAIPTQSKKTASVNALLDGLHTAYLAGCPLNMNYLFPKKGNFVQLPNYPWQREKHWYTLTSEGSDLVNRNRVHPLLGYRMLSAAAQWENQLDTHKLPFLQDHVVDNGVIFPASGYIEMSIAASELWFGTESNSHEIEHLEIRAPIVLDTAKSTRFSLSPEDGSFTIESRDRLSDTPWTVNVVGRLLGTSNKHAPDKLDTTLIVAQADLHITSAGHYQLTQSVGLNYGPCFQGIADVWVAAPAPSRSSSPSLSALARLEIPAEININYADYHLHPAMLDAGFQLLVDVFSQDINNGMMAALIPIQVGKLYVYPQQETSVLTYLQVSILKQSPQSVVADFYLADAAGNIMAELQACRFKGVQLAQSRVVDPASYVFNAYLMPPKNQQQSAPKLAPAKLVKKALKYLNKQAPTLKREHHFQQILPLFDLMISMYVWRSLSALHTSKNAFSVASYIKNSAIDIKHKPLLLRLLQMLEADNLLIPQNGAEQDNKQTDKQRGKQSSTIKKWTFATDSEFPDAQDIWLSILGDSPAYLPELLLLGRCGTHLADVLRNKQTANTLITPAKSSIQDHWYHASQSYTAINQALCQIITQIVSQWPQNRRLRILEVGAGNAGLTRKLLPLLPAEQCDYLFTDSNEDAVSKAAMELKDWSFLTTQVININADLEDIDPHSFDLIIAANTLYQANSLPQTLSHLHPLLAENGLLLLQERQPDAFTDFTLGLDPKWWAHSSEEDIDNGHPVSLLLSLKEWKNALQHAHFEQLTPLTESDATADEGAFLLLATAQKTRQSLSEKSYEQSSENTQNWMLVVDPSGFSQKLGKQLTRLLEARQQRVILVEAAHKYKAITRSRFKVDVNKENAFDAVFKALDKTNIHCEHIIHLAGLDTQLSTDPLALQQQRCISTVDLIQGVEQHLTDPDSQPKLWLVTANAAVIEQIDPHISHPQPDQAALWGLGRVIMNEHPDLNCRLIDLQLTSNWSAANALLTEILDEHADDNEILLSENARHVLRMRRISLQDSTKENTNRIITSPHKKTNSPAIGLSFKTPGPLKNLYWRSLPSQTLADNEIEIRPYATGLNYRDVMYAIGLLSDEAVENGFAGPTLGMELSGKVVNVGKNISDYQPGDKVIGFAPACFSSRVITETTAIAHMPPAWSYAEAATIPTTFFTVYYALHQLAQIRTGEKILIHGAAGGVGIAAIQFARYRGAEIFATAGTEEKREFVRLLGADHVLDSRSLAFSDDVMKVTHGEGVDIVLNSLAGEAINRNLSILKPFGRFLELGKRDYYENKKIGLRPFRNNISYFGIDADQLLIERPDLAAELFQEMMGLFEQGVLRPLPHRVFPARQIEDAFRYMQQSRQIGKVIVSFEGERPLAEDMVTQAHTALACDPDGCYLISGGLGGFGLKTAQWLTEKGATSLVLCSRTGTPDEASLATLQTLQDQGIKLHLRSCNITDKQAVNQLFAEFGNTLPDLKGIIHAAMVLDDALMRNMNHAQFTKVLAPKIAGAWNLHVATTQDSTFELEFFVMYSSATTYLGNPGQANYVAGNQYLECLASYRKSLGLPATYAAWGAIDDVGFLARNEDIKEALQSRLGGSPLSSTQALLMLEKLLASNQTGAAIIDLDWNVIQRIMPGARAPKYTEQQRQVKHSDADHKDIKTLIANKSPEEIQALVTDLLLNEIEQILRLPKEKLDTQASVFDIGMDSLMGMELVLAIEERFNVRLPVMALTEGATITRIAERICQQLLTPTESDALNETSPKTRHEEAVAIAATQHAEEVDTEKLEKITKALEEDEDREGTHG